VSHRVYTCYVYMIVPWHAGTINQSLFVVTYYSNLHNTSILLQYVLIGIIFNTLRDLTNVCFWKFIILNQLF